MMIYHLLLMAVLVYGAGKLEAWTLERFFARTRIGIGTEQAVASISRYVIVTIVLMIIKVIRQRESPVF